MTTRALYIFTAFLVVALLVCAAPSLLSKQSAPAPVDVITLKGSINPSSAQFIVRAISEAERDGAQAIIIRLDTPGGLMDSMRKIVQKELLAKVPVVVYVAPSGARAASAGAFITLAGHVAAMAPVTNIGSAHPVSGMGEKMDETMSRKIENDAAEYIKTIAHQRGRNVEWAELAVRKSANVRETIALQKRVVDYIATDVRDLLKKIDGRKIKIKEETITLNTANAPTRTIKMNAREQFLHVLSDPNILYILILIAMYGIIFELSNPGAILPGVLGGIALILVLYSIAILPVNVAGIALLILAIILFIVDLNVPSHGILTAGAIISFILGSFMIFDLSSPVFRISIFLIVGAALTTAGFFLFLVGSGVKALKNRLVSGTESMAGMIGDARTDIDPVGRVFADGTYWTATSEERIKAGEKVRIVSMDGLKIKVKREETK
ncbi:MAG: nodulation protein NfeD [Armatimonadota bacterium]|nr:nodulation protein NfeD [Armatimonadota bacterium]